MVEVEALFDYTAEQEDELTMKKGDVITNVAQIEGGWWEGDFNGKRGMFPDNFVKVLAKELKKAIRNSSLIKDQIVITDGSVNFRKEKKRKCKVLYSYLPVNEDELALEVNDVIDVVEEVEEGWWKGTVKGKSGVFPSNFVEEIEGADGDKNTEISLTETTPSPNAAQIKPRPIKGVGYGNIFQDGLVKLKATSNPSHDSKMLQTTIPPKKPTIPNLATCTDAPQLPPKRVKDQAKVLFSYDAQNDDELTLKEGDVITVLSKDIEDQGWWKGELNGRVGVFPDNFVELIVEDSRPKKPERPEKMPSITKPSIKSEKDVTDGSSVSKNSSFKDKSEIVTSPTNKEKVSSLPRGLNKGISLDVPRKDEKMERPDKVVPPLPTKKPQLPPPLKKVSRLSANFGPSVGSVLPNVPPHIRTSIGPSPSTESLSGESNPKPQSLKTDSPGNNSVDFDGVESAAEKLVHLTANRVKNPNRRPPSHIFLKGDHNDGLQEKVNGDVENKTPWMQELKKNQAKRNSHFSNDLPHIKDAIPEVDEKYFSRIGSLKSTETEDKSCVKLSSSSLKNQTPLSSPNKPKCNDVNSKDIKLETPSSDIAHFPMLTGEPTLAELARFYSFLRENVVTKLEYQESRKEYSDLREAFDTFKKNSTLRVNELVNEIQAEKSQRQALQAEVDRLRLQSTKK